MKFPVFSCRPFAAVPADDQPGAHRPKRPPEVFVRPAAVEPAAGLPRGLGPAHQPQHEGRGQAGIHTEALLSGGDGRRSLQARRDGNFRPTVPTVLEEHMRRFANPWIMLTSFGLGVSSPVRRRRGEGGGDKSAAGWKSLAPHASYLDSLPFKSSQGIIGILF